MIGWFAQGCVIGYWLMEVLSANTKNTVKNQKTIILTANNINELLSQLKKSSVDSDLPAYHSLLLMYNMERSFPDLGDFRLGPNAFNKIPLSIIILIDNHTGQLIAHGLLTDIYWEGTEVPARGWQGVVRVSYTQHLEKLTKNTLVGLYIRVENSYKRHGWAEQMILLMKSHCKPSGKKSLIIPLRLPKRMTSDYLKFSYIKFTQLKNQNGDYLDHWLRIHTRLGAKVLGVSLDSHQHVMNLDDFVCFFNTKRLKRSGYYIAERQGLCYNAYVDMKRDFALIRQECTWVEHIAD